MYAVYRLLTSALFLPVSLIGQYIRDDGMRQRLGNYSESLIRQISGTPRIWVHAVSVGEVGVAVSVINALKKMMPDCAIILSTTTAHGQNFARHKLDNMAVCIYAPLDFPIAIRRALAAIRPDIMIFLETEIWPNWLTECRARGIKTALVNGRISVRSIKKYLKIKPLLTEIFDGINLFSMIGAEDAERIRLLGAPAEKIRISGNAKYELLTGSEDSRIPENMARIYNICGQPVFVSGSTRNHEEEIILDAYREILCVFPDTLLIIAPRHVERSEQIGKLVIRHGFTCQFRTQLNQAPRTAPVVILDTIGELQAAYSIASVVFCGGSLVPLGGQNIMEPAAWEKPVFYGPSTEDFQDARALLEKHGGGMMVKDGHDLAEKAVYYLSHPHEALMAGRQAKQALLHHKGAAARHAEAICHLTE
jgi:3-deoxy-D-manno-octulosonic-acid transferase